MSIITVRVGKVGLSVDFEPEKLPPASLEYALNYGLTQAINDAHAAIARKNFETDEAFRAAVQAKVDARVEQILTGNVPGSRAPADPAAAMARKAVKELGGITEQEWEMVKAEIAKARAQAPVEAPAKGKKAA